LLAGAHWDDRSSTTARFHPIARGTSALSDLAVSDAPASSFVVSRDRHLKWTGLDWLEALLYVLCGICIIGFSVCVFCDVVTREIGRPWLWLQQFTTGFFAWGVFLGMALAARRNDHMYLAEIVQSLQGSRRRNLEVVSRLVVLVVALLMVYFGILNFRNDMGSYRMPSLIPLGYYTVSVPIAGALVALFQIEQVVNGLKNGFAGPQVATVELKTADRAGEMAS
jgi:TRAP-type transport system small permease protein